MQGKFNVRTVTTALLMIGCGNGDERIGGSGLIEADEVVVSSEGQGRVEALYFDEGDIVNQEDTLLVIDPSRLELEFKAAQSAYHVSQQKLNTIKIQMEQAVQAERFSESERDRILTLAKSGSATQKQLDQLEFELAEATLTRQAADANVKTVEAELKKLEADINKINREISDCYPVAPITGTVIEKYIESGELLAKGRPIVKIAGLDTVWVKVYLSSGDFASIKIGDAANIDTESGGKSYCGKVVWTSEEAEFTPKNIQTKSARANLVYAVKVKIPNSDNRLKIGMPVYVTLDQ